LISGNRKQMVWFNTISNGWLGLRDQEMR